MNTTSKYYDELRNVTENSAWEDWILYMLEAIEATSIETKDKIIAILDAMEKAKKLISEKAPKIYSKDLLEAIYQNPYCKIGFLDQLGIAKRQTVASYLQTLEDIGLLDSVKLGKEKYYINKKISKNTKIVTY